MAQRVITQLVDDLDGRELRQGQGETVTFGMDGVFYEIDLSSKNARKLRAALEPFIAAGRRTSGGPRAPRGVRDGRSNRARARSRASSGPGTSRTPLAHIRAWARDNGYEVSERGRISEAVKEAYEQANS